MSVLYVYEKKHTYQDSSFLSVKATYRIEFMVQDITDLDALSKKFSPYNAKLHSFFFKKCRKGELMDFQGFASIRDSKNFYVLQVVRYREKDSLLEDLIKEVETWEY